MTGALKRFLRDLYGYLFFPFGQFRGIYTSFADARKAGRGRLVGYDSELMAKQYEAWFDLKPDSTEYAVFFHLERLLGQRTTILDFGGNMGDSYLRFSKYVGKKDLFWIVCDVPHITQLGRRVCESVDNISFIDDLSELNGRRIDIFLVSGALQYVDVRSPAEVLRHAMDDTWRPSHILIDAIPLSDGEEFVTLQNGDVAVYPHRVANREKFISDICALGYRLSDEWSVKYYRCVVPFHRKLSLPSYSGLLFTSTVIGGDTKAG